MGAFNLLELLFKTWTQWNLTVLDQISETKALENKRYVGCGVFAWLVHMGYTHYQLGRFYPWALYKT